MGYGRPRHSDLGCDGAIGSLAPNAPEARRGVPGTAPITPTAPVILPTEPASPTPFTIAINWDASVALAPPGFSSDILAAVLFLETQFTDPVTITINVGYQEIAGNALGRGDLGESLTSMGNVSYADLVNAVTAGATTATDASVAASLPESNPIGGGNLWVTTAQAKALGLPASALSNTDGSAEDGSIGFGAASQFTYGVTNDGGAVALGTYDFFATVLHELTEVMGRQLLTGTVENGFPNSYTLLDLLHYSAAGKRDFSQFAPGYFSPDGGVSNLGSFNTNAGGDAGDWASSVRDDPFDAFAVSGVPETASSNDLTVMDAIGWRPAGSNGSSAPPVTPPVSLPVATPVTSPITSPVTPPLTSPALPSVTPTAGPSFLAPFLPMISPFSPFVPFASAMPPHPTASGAPEPLTGISFTGETTSVRHYPRR